MPQAQVDPRPRPRGRKAVEDRLIEAAAEGLAEIGPKQLSIRVICQRAKVNPGQVYHYFGSKKALLAAGMRRLATEHWESTARRTAGGVPPPFGVAADAHYWRAVCHVLLDGEVDLARIEIEEGVSVPGHGLAILTRKHGGQLDLEFKARYVANVALQLGWVVFEEFLFALLGAEDAGTRANIRREVVRLTLEAGFHPQFDQGEWMAGVETGDGGPHGA